MLHLKGLCRFIFINCTILLLCVHAPCYADASVVPLNIKCTSDSCVNEGTSINASGNFSLDPCNDFYEYACANFDQLNPLPDGKYLWDNYQILQNMSDYIAKDLLSMPVDATAPAAVQKAKQMFDGCMDTDSLDARGLTPLLDMMEQLGGWPLIDPNWKSEIGWQELAAIIAEYGVPMIFEIVVRTNMNNATNTLLYIDQPALYLPVPVHPFENFDSLTMVEKMLEGDKATDSYYTLFLNKIALHLRDHLGTNVTDESIIGDLREVIQFMRDLFTAKAVPPESNPMGFPTSGEITFAELQEWTDGLPENVMKVNWVNFFQVIYSNTDVEITSDDSVFIFNLPALGRIMTLFSLTEPRVIANFVISRLLAYLSPETDEYMRNASTWYFVAQNVIPPDYERWMYCVHKVNDYPRIGLSMGVAYLFKQQEIDDEKLTKAGEMIDDLQAAFQELLDASTWMDEPTRQYAKVKAEGMAVLQGFPYWMNDTAQLDLYYDKLLIDRNDHCGNTKRLRTFMHAKNLAGIAIPRDQFEWTQSPLIVNAFYNTLNNRITFPAAIMNDPFFSGRTVGAVDYGRIGAIIGHEITHGFDYSGRLFNKDGTVFNWWSNETSQAFLEKEFCFIGQYNNYHIPEINQYVNGTITRQENVADNGGLRESFRAFQRLRQRDPIRGNARLPGLERFSPDQLFFLAYGSMWCRVETPIGLALMAKDSHSPNRFRVIGAVSNMEEFSQAWGCEAGSSMNPQDKCILW